MLCNKVHILSSVALLCNYEHMALREVVLTVLARRKMTGYEITRTFDRVLSYFWRASHQQVYRELARLHAQHCVVYEAVAQTGRPDKKIY